MLRRRVKVMTGQKKKVMQVCSAQVQINKNFQRKIVNIFLPINFNMCFGCSKEPTTYVWDEK